MSPRRPAALRGRGDQDLRSHLITTAAALLEERGSAGVAVRDIARAAKVADGALYNYFEDKEDLLAQALLVHVGSVMRSAPPMPEPGSGSVTDNLALFIDNGMALLARVAPAFAGLLSQPRVLSRFHALVGGDHAFGAPRGPAGQPPGDATATGAGAGGIEGSSLPEVLGAYLRAERELGRIDPEADLDAATSLVVGAIHGHVLPQVLFSPPGSTAVLSTPPGVARRLAVTLLEGVAGG